MWTVYTVLNIDVITHYVCYVSFNFVLDFNTKYVDVSISFKGEHFLQ